VSGGDLREKKGRQGKKRISPEGSVDQVGRLLTKRLRYSPLHLKGNRGPNIVSEGQREMSPLTCTDGKKIGGVETESSPTKGTSPRDGRALLLGTYEKIKTSPEKKRRG